MEKDLFNAPRRLAKIQATTLALYEVKFKLKHVGRLNNFWARMNNNTKDILVIGENHVV